MDNTLTPFEITRLIGDRAKQLSHGAEPTVKFSGVFNPLKIAEQELREGTIPLCVERTLPNGDKVRIRIVKQ